MSALIASLAAAFGGKMMVMLAFLVVMAVNAVLSAIKMLIDKMIPEEKDPEKKAKQGMISKGLEYALMVIAKVIDILSGNLEHK